MSKGNPPLRSVRSASRRKPALVRTPVLTLPLFEDNRAQLIECAQLLHRAENGAAYTLLNKVWQRSRRVSSDRYQRLSDYLRHALLAIETGEFEGSRYVLLSAMTSFGWADAK